MEPSDSPDGGVQRPAKRRARRAPRSVPDEDELPAANHTNPVQVMPCQIQSVFKSDAQGRRYMVLENLPADKNYVANLINTGGEFAIGGTPAFICDALANELEARAVQGSREQREQSWHIIALPDSNMSNQTISHLYRGSETTDRYPMATKVRPIQQSRQGNQQDLGLQQNSQAIQTAITAQIRALYDQQANLVQQSPYLGQQVAVPHQDFFRNEQPIPAANSATSGYGREYSSVPQPPQVRLTTPMLENFSEGSGSTAMFLQGQPYSHTQQQGSYPGFGPSSGPAQGSYQAQGNNMMFGPNNGFPMAPLPQAHRPIFDGLGFIIGEQACKIEDGMYGGNLYNDEMHRARMYNDVGYPHPHQSQGPQQRFDDPQQAQGTITRMDPQLMDDTQSFYNFVANTIEDDEIDQGEHNQQEDNQQESGQEEDDPEEDDPEEGDPEYGDPDDSEPEDGDPEEGEQDEGLRIDNDQEHIGAEEVQTRDEGIAMGNTSRNDTISPNGPQRPPRQRPEMPPAEMLWARERSPHRFQDRTGTGMCDYCDRVGHEAEACLKWDPDHYDKPVCTACNNKEHSLDECPRFRAMPLAEKRALLVGKGAGRPGVRSQYYAWTKYVGQGHGHGHGHGDAGVPLTRRFVQDLSNTLGSGGGGSDIWEDWDYGQGIPDEFRDSVAEVLAADQPGLVDERFMGGNHGFRRNDQAGANL
ncbi:hypothetical protein KVR01_007676 [Diaporthe batatas]|uniref:uncharacterized protein n=1 Tax=Diaporthe batatas TaxID=748121 RepID=UPI001D03F384|nr:uncharacterized protein KVR01_007676 [Diaporthe batatas]KAG8161911.1 hypothetical protein KVR01_007676 [Diaporthe batatas]